MLIDSEIIINFILQFITKKLNLESIVTYVNFNVNALNKQLSKIYNLHKKSLNL